MSLFLVCFEFHPLFILSVFLLLKEVCLSGICVVLGNFPNSCTKRKEKLNYESLLSRGIEKKDSR